MAQIGYIGHNHGPRNTELARYVAGAHAQNCKSVNLRTAQSNRRLSF